MRHRPGHRRIGFAAASLGLAALTFASSMPAPPHAVHAMADMPGMAPPDAGSFQAKYDFFTNFGHYLPRIHCIRNADGNPDWPWIGVLLALNVTVIVGYLKIFRFWRRCYLAESPADRDTKLMDLARIFLFCAACGYGFFIITLFWPGYRLLAFFMVALSVFTWRFAADLSAFRISFSAKRLHRELQESLQRRNDELELLVATRTTELQRANHFKGMFLANMSHEIRTPMTAILGFADLLADPTLQSGEAGEYVATIRRNGQHLLGLVNDVLDLSKIEAGKMRVDRVATDIGRLTNEVADSLRPRATARGLDLHVRLDPELPRTVRIDPLRVRQILTNLVGNAVKFTDKGSVTIDVRHTASPPTLHLAVTDTGRGLSAHDLATVFNRFEQAGEMPTSGTGLGLTISQNLARLLGGDISVTSEPGVGSTFRVTIAADAVETVASDTPCEPAARPLDGVRVLVAEDAADSQLLLRKLLTGWGATAEIVDDGVAAVERVAAGPAFDLVLLDVQMPRLDGLSAARQIRDGGYTGPILALTANALIDDRGACLAAGCNEHVAKPIDARALLATLCVALPRVAGATA